MSKLSKFYPVVLAIAGFAPAIALAQDATQVNNILINIDAALDTIVAILFLLEALFFIWGVIQFIIKADPKSSEQGRSYMLWSIIAMTATVAAWGIVKLLVRYFGVGGVTTPLIPGGIQ